jgi:uncharacterized protein YbjT (DUF2867 family)
MRILIVGATGLVGSTLCSRLAIHGHEVIAAARRRPRNARQAHWVVIDLNVVVHADDWAPHLDGVDAVVNCAGVLQDTARDKVAPVHQQAVGALFLACERQSVRRVIHFSALGVDRAQPSAFSQSKLAGDRELAERNLEWVILRPSVIVGRPVYGASALIRGLAALPWRPSMPNTGKVQVVQLDDVVSTVEFFLRLDSPSRVVLELAGPRALSFDEIVDAYRDWLGWRPSRLIQLPGWMAHLLYRFGDLAGMLGWRPPLRTNAEKEIERGAVGDPSRWISMTGIDPKGLNDALRSNPATIQDKWFAGLYVLKPVVFTVIPFFWIATGIISLTTGFENGINLMRDAGAGALSGPSVVAGAIADMGIGGLVAYRSTSRRGLYCAIVLSFIYLIAGTVLRPDLWNEPLGPFLKIFPIIVLHFIALAILEER